MAPDPEALPTGRQIKRAREARRMTQEELARAIGVGTRTIGRWERGETVPRSAVGALEQILHLDPTEPSTEPVLSEASDAELVAELARRLSRTRSRPGGAGDLPSEHFRWPKSVAPSQRGAERLPQQTDEK